MAGHDGRNMGLSWAAGKIVNAGKTTLV